MTVEWAITVFGSMTYFLVIFGKYILEPVTKDQMLFDIASALD